MTAPSSPYSIYQERREAFATEEKRLAGISLRFSILRGGLFLVFAACLLLILLRGGRPGWEWWAGAGFWLVAFLAVLPPHERIVKRLQRQRELRRLNEEGLLRLVRDWKHLPPASLPEPEEGDRALARDLNLSGRASLAQLLRTLHSPPGKAVLGSWLLHPAPPAEIAVRQAAVAELAPEVDLRQQVEVGVRPMEKSPPDLEPFFGWAESEPWLLKHPSELNVARFLGIATPAALLLWAASLLPIGVFIFLVIVNVQMGYRLRKQTLDVFDKAQAREDDFQRYADALERISSRQWAAVDLQSLAGGLTLKGQPAHRWMNLLHRRVELADVRHSAYLHLLLQGLLCWDVHVLALLERWQRDAGSHVRGWLAALGRFEALSALAALSFENPGWTFPVVAEGEPSYVAQGLGHPLIRDGQRVANDVTLGPAGTFLLVTGSNMSGKSTLLRSIGINAVLAQAGGPVCARSLRMPPVTLGTSILVEDSLAEGVSFFMAELQRIRDIVKEADRARAAGGILLYLLDEVLRGTNSYERQVAVRRVVLHLLKQGALGAVSTHDLQLAEVPEIAATFVPVHFRETLHPGEDPPMTFDYVMHPGVATTVNALKLMELVGLGAEEI